MMHNLSTRENLYGQADFRLFMPYKVGHNAIVIGDSIELVQSLGYGGVFPIQISKNGEPSSSAGDHLCANELDIPIAANQIEHIFVPEYSCTAMQDFLLELSRLIKPGGWVFIGVKNRWSIETGIKLVLSKFKYSKRLEVSRDLPSCSMSQWKRLLIDFNFQKIHFYGIWSNLKFPGFYFPIERPAILRKFYRDMYSSFSLKDSFLHRLGLLFCSLGLQSTLFTHYCVIAQKGIPAEAHSD
jgi:hypothetical protein